MAFNSFPTNAVGGDGVSTASFSSAPTLTGTQLPSYWNNKGSDRLEGFAASARSSIHVPSSPTAALECLDSTGSVLWNHTPAAINGTTNDWIGFWMNVAADLLYVVARDNSPTPDEYVLATIDLAGTIVVIGSDTLDFNGSTADWTVNSMIQPDGSGGFDIRLGNNIANMDSSGTFTTAATAASASSGGVSGYAYKTDNGYWLFDLFAQITPMNMSIRIDNTIDNAYMTLLYHSILGASETSAAGFIEWRDYVVGVDGSGAARNALRKFSKAQINTFASQLATYAGVKL